VGVSDMPSESLPEVWISLDLVARESGEVDFDPDYVTRELGVVPTQQNRVGDAIRAGQGRRTFTRWRLSVGPADTLTIDAMMAEMLLLVRPASSRLRSVSKQIGVTPVLTCAVRPRATGATDGGYVTPDVRFPLDIVQWAAENAVVLAVDILL
jgi:Domain of unknown function (DUF4279)